VTSNAITAWNAGATGRGVTVAVVDSGINPALAEFAGRIHPGSRDLGAERGVVDNEGHGTAVSAVIGAARNGSGMMGVAFDSTILSFNTSNPNNCDDKGCKHSDAAIGTAIDLARQNGARVINISLGGDGVGSQVLNAARRAAEAGIVVVISSGNDGKADPSTFARNIGATASLGNVIIAGSLGVAVNGDPAQGTDISQMSSFSNLAGGSANIFLAALGYRVRTIDQNGTGYLYSGTSFAAPVISGAAALLAQAFPNLTGAQIVQLLLSTADDLGAQGTDATFGRGRLNVANAMRPQGRLSMAGSGVPVPSGPSDASGAMGDAGGQSFGAIILDGYERAYVMEIANQLRRAPERRPLAEALQGRYSTGFAEAGHTSVSITMERNPFGGGTVGLAQTGLGQEHAAQARMVAGHAVSRLTPQTAVALGFSESGHTLQQRLSRVPGGAAFLVARDPMARAGFQADASNSLGIRHDLGPAALTVTSERGQVVLPSRARDADAPSYSIAAATLDRRVGAARLSLGGSRMEEQATVLGGRLALAPGGATSWFLDAGVGYDLGGGWDAAASYRRGWTALAASGLVTGGRLETEAWAVDLTRRGAFVAGDRFGLRLMQPLRVASGGYGMNLPVSYDYADGSVGYAAQRFSLAPRGREIDLEAAYSLPVLGGAGDLSANAFLRRQPDHVAAARDDIGTAIRFTLGF
jgi:hypothetical protein